MYAKQNTIPFWMCRKGAVVEFEVFTGKPEVGVIDALTMNGPRSFLALLSKVTDSDGVEHGPINPFTKSQRAINLSHATKVLQRSEGPLEFKDDDSFLNRCRAENADARKNGIIVRRGHRLVIDGTVHYAPFRARAVLYAFVKENQKTLSIQPWELIDFDALYSALFKNGVAQTYQTSEHKHFPPRVDVNMRKLKHFLRHNVNRFKANLSEAERADDLLQAELDEARDDHSSYY